VTPASNVPAETGGFKAKPKRDLLKRSYSDIFVLKGRGGGAEATSLLIKPEAGGRKKMQKAKMWKAAPFANAPQGQVQS
jgi:hypothetical protein